MNETERVVWVGRGRIALAGAMREPFEAFDIPRAELVKLQRMGRVSALHLMTATRFVSFVRGLTPNALADACRRARVDHTGAADALSARLVELVDGYDVSEDVASADKAQEVEKAEEAQEVRDTSPKRLPIAERRELVVELRASGMTLDAIAEKVGVSVSTVSKDLAAMEEEG